MTRRAALVIGEALIDEYPTRRMAAGAPLHVAIRLASLGWSARLVTRVGDDADGRAIIETVQRFGGDTSLIEIDPFLPTGTTTIDMTGTDHSFRVNPGAWDALAGPDPVPAADVVCFGTLPLRDPRSRSTVSRIAAATDATVVVDLNLRAPDFDDERIRTAVGHADVLKLNEDELAIAGAALGCRPTAAALHPAGPTWVCVTRGADGAELSHRDGRRWTVAAPRIDVVDTVGAGDAFLATLIDGILRDEAPDLVLETAARIGAETAARPGGLPPEPEPHP